MELGHRDRRDSYVYDPSVKGFDSTLLSIVERRSEAASRPRETANTGRARDGRANHRGLRVRKPGGIRDVLPSGQILARNIWDILPFDNRLVIGTFKGSQLPPTVTRGRPVNPDQEYKLVTTDFTAANQDNPAELRSHGLQFPAKGAVIRDAVIDWIRKKKLIE